MQALTSNEVRKSFVNCSRSQLATMSLPRLEGIKWNHLDYLGWRDQRAPQRAYLVTNHDERLVGVELRAPSSSTTRRGSGLCSICRTSHPPDGVRLFVARRAGAAGRNDNTVGTYVCADLACSLYVRGLLPLELPQGETLPPQERAARLLRRLADFIDAVLAP